MFKARKVLMVISLLLIVIMPMLIAAAPAQGEEPPTTEETDGEETALDLLAPVGDAISNIVVIVIGLGIFLFGTVQGTQVAKIFFPKSTDPGGWWYKARPYVLRGMSLVIAVWAMVGLKFDAFSILSEINETFTVDPIFGQLFSGIALSFASNKYYDKYEKTGN